MSAFTALPIDHFFRPPTTSKTQISPDGRRIAFLASWEGHLNVWVRDVEEVVSGGGSGTARRLTAERTRSLESFFWDPAGTSIFYRQDFDGNENHHLFRVDVDTACILDLTPYPEVRMFAFTMNPTDTNSAYIDLNLRSPEAVDTYRIDLTTGNLTLMVDAADKAGGSALISPLGEVFLVGLGDAGDWHLSALRDGCTTRVASFNGPDHVLGPLPVRFTPDGTGIWVGTNRNSDRTRLVRIDLDTGVEYGVDSHPVHDLDTPRPEADPRFPSSLIVHQSTGDLLGVRYLGERAVVHPVDERFAEVLEQLQQLNDGDLGHVCCDAEGMLWIAEFTADRLPGETWLYDHRVREAYVVSRSHPHLDADTLASVMPITVSSRDGLDLHCHLTLPLGQEPRNLPTVVLLHGGPWYRDDWTYDPEVQFLANRGYAVLQVNFRGSTGYGKAFMKAGVGEFAGRMHDDVIDALDHVIKQRVTDPARVAIFGSSYGGYAALVGATLTPDRFAAAISYAGMSDLVRLYDESLPAARGSLATSYGLHIGDPSDPEQHARMMQRSPTTHLDKVVAPIMLIHGEQDVRVSRTHSDVVARALQARGIEVDYFLVPDEGHWFVNSENIINLYSRLERFLGRHLLGEATNRP